jgi:hypothetical protein
MVGVVVVVMLMGAGGAFPVKVVVEVAHVIPHEQIVGQGLVVNITTAIQNLMLRLDTVY